MISNNFSYIFWTISADMNSIQLDIGQWKYENIGNWPIDFTKDRLLPMYIGKNSTLCSNYRQLASKASKTSRTLSPSVNNLAHRES